MRQRPNCDAQFSPALPLSCSLTLYCSLSLALMWTTPAAQAQTAPAADAPAPDPQVVIVTAQKRAEALQTVPISVTALDAQDLSKMGVEHLSDLAREVPGLTVVSSGPGQNILIMRGISSAAGTAGTVGYYLDDTPISASSNASLLSQRGLIDPSVFDIARVEVLRGPQGTLYGSSSMGGTIKYVSTQPDLNHLSGKTDVTLSHTEGGGWNKEVNATLNIPLLDNRAALRIGVYDRNQDGYINRYPIAGNDILAVAPGSAAQDGVNAEHTKGVRAMLRMLFDDQWSATVSYYYQHMLLDAPFQIDV